MKAQITGLFILVSISGCNNSYPEKVVARNGRATVVEIDETVASQLPCFENFSELNNRPYKIIKVIQETWPKPIGETLHKDRAISTLKYQAWKIKADAIVFEGITSTPAPANYPGHVYFISKASVIKFL